MAAIEGGRTFYIRLAEAALIDMLEPSTTMTDAGDNVEVDGISLIGCGESYLVLRAMIQAALDESTTPPS